MDAYLDMSSFVQSREGVLSILELEETRYYQMLRKGEAAVRTALKSLPKDAAEIPDETLFRLAEERGLNPEMTVSIAHGLGWERLTVRVGFAADMASRNAQMTKAAANSREVQSIVDVDSMLGTLQD